MSPAFAQAPTTAQDSTGGQAQANLRGDSSPVSGAEAWRGIYSELKIRDEKTAKEYQEEVDTLLVFVCRLIS
jgi:hypothetical protein